MSFLIIAINNKSHDELTEWIHKHLEAVCI